MIINYNYYLRLILENRDQDDKVSKAALKYYDLLDKYERQSLDEIPRVMNNLEKSLDSNPLASVGTPSLGLGDTGIVDSRSILTACQRP